MSGHHKPFRLRSISLVVAAAAGCTALLLFAGHVLVGCGNDGTDDGDESAYSASNEVPSFLTADNDPPPPQREEQPQPPANATDDGETAEQEPENESSPEHAENDPDGDEHEDSNGNGNGNGNGTSESSEYDDDTTASESSEPDSQDESSLSPLERLLKDGDNDDGQDWAAVVTDFPEPPAGLPDGGAATADAAARRYLTFLCTGDLDLYVTTVHPSWLEGLERDDLRELRDEMIQHGFPKRFEMQPILDEPQAVGSERHAVAPFELFFERGHVQRGTLWLENIGDEEQPRWVHSDRPRRD